MTASSIDAYAVCMKTMGRLTLVPPIARGKTNMRELNDAYKLIRIFNSQSPAIKQLSFRTRLKLAIDKYFVEPPDLSVLSQPDTEIVGHKKTCEADK